MITATISMKRRVPVWMIVAAILCMSPFIGLDRACGVAAHKLFRVEIK